MPKQRKEICFESLSTYFKVICVYVYAYVHRADTSLVVVTEEVTEMWSHTSHTTFKCTSTHSCWQASNYSLKACSRANSITLLYISRNKWDFPTENIKTFWYEMTIDESWQTEALKLNCKLFKLRALFVCPVMWFLGTARIRTERAASLDMFSSCFPSRRQWCILIAIYHVWCHSYLTVFSHKWKFSLIFTVMKAHILPSV